MSSTRTTRPGRLRWLAAGAAATLALGAGATTWQATASTGGDESTFVPVTPTRILDTRVDLGLDGPFISPQPRQLTVTGTIDTADGTKLVVPTHANGIALNVTAVQPTAAGFISVRPGDASGAPTTSSLNFDGGETTPNAVTVSLPTDGTDAGTIEITYDAYGHADFATEILVDVVGYTTTAGLDAIVADLAQKANTTDVLPRGEITIGHGNALMPQHDDQNFPSPGDYKIYSTVSAMPADGRLLANLDGPLSIGGVEYALSRVDYCLSFVTGEGSLSVVAVFPDGAADADDGIVEFPNTTTVGCRSIDVDLPPASGYVLDLRSGRDEGYTGITSVRSTWVPVG